ncbi:MAG: dTDP-4-dehydrorhamnose 3,5-epimerase [Bacteroidales bacterium]|jgi:dTDP-4-dehydrorhamnose 3,5-epimerase|nr:dTDP-4-dehydrorhamnose 3,5-epimerase [Bacteroidales bacterium]
MEIQKTTIDGLLILVPAVFKDDRGVFFESYNRQLFASCVGDAVFVQDNQSISHKGVIRGLHLQVPPFAQGKLVRVVHGAVLDVAVDLRKTSPTFGKHFSIKLDALNNLSFWIPEGFAHGFVALENNTIFQYKVTNYYNKDSETSIRWNDPALNIQWETESPIVSEKDKQSPLFKDFVSPFD